MLLLRLRHLWISLRTWSPVRFRCVASVLVINWLPQDETNPDTHVSLPGDELRLVQEDGNFRTHLQPTGLISTSDTPYQRAKPATKREMTQFHSDEYVEFLARVTPGNMNSYIKEQHKCAYIC